MTSGSSLSGKLQEEGGDATLLAQATRCREPGLPSHVAEYPRTLTGNLGDYTHGAHYPPSTLGKGRTDGADGGR